MKNPRDIILAPVVSEKSYSLLEQNTYTFIVQMGASKPEIHDAIQSIFGVKVTRVNTQVRAGKRTRNRRTGKYSSRPDTKRALVTLADGDSLPIFES